MDGAFKLPKEFTPAIMRLAGYSKNVTQIIPQNQQNYNQSTPAQFFLPQAIIDLRSLVMYFSIILNTPGGTGITAEIQSAQARAETTYLGLVTTGGNFYVTYNGITAGPFADNISVDGGGGGAGNGTINNLTAQINLAFFGIPATNIATPAANTLPIIAGPANQAGFRANNGIITFTFANVSITQSATNQPYPIPYYVGPQASYGNNNLLITINGFNVTNGTANPTIFTTNVSTVWAGSGVAIPRNIESLIDRYEFSVGGFSGNSFWPQSIAIMVT